MATETPDPAPRALLPAELELRKRIAVKADELDKLLLEILQLKGQAPAGVLAMIAKNAGFARKYLSQATQHALQAIDNVKE